MRRTAKPANQALSPNSLKTLEFHAIRELLAGFSGTEVARAAARELLPDVSREIVAGKLLETSEARSYLEECGQEPFSAVPPIGALIARAQPLSSRLEPGELQEIALFASVTDEIATRIGGFERAPTLRTERSVRASPASRQPDRTALWGSCAACSRPSPRDAIASRSP